MSCSVTKHNYLEILSNMVVKFRITEIVFSGFSLNIVDTVNDIKEEGRYYVRDIEKFVEAEKDISELRFTVKKLTPAEVVLNFHECGEAVYEGEDIANDSDVDTEYIDTIYSEYGISLPVAIISNNLGYFWCRVTI